MKIAHGLIGAAVALGALQPLSAEARVWRGNVVQVEQVGSHNAAGAAQTGANNGARIVQRGNNNLGTVTQDGDRNRGCLYQLGSGLEAHLAQSGDDNRTTVLQTQNVQRVAQGPIVYGRLVFQCR